MNKHTMKKHSKEWARNEIMKALPIENFSRFCIYRYHPDYSLLIPNQALEMRDEGLIEIDKGVITKK